MRCIQNCGRILFFENGCPLSSNELATQYASLLLSRTSVIPAFIKPKIFEFSLQDLVNRIFCTICGIPFQQADEFKNSSNCEILHEQKL